MEYRKQIQQRGVRKQLRIHQRSNADQQASKRRDQGWKQIVYSILCRETDLLILMKDATVRSAEIQALRWQILGYITIRKTQVFRIVWREKSQTTSKCFT